MPNIKSAKKRMKTSEAARARNRAVKSRIKKAIKKAREALELKDTSNAEKAVFEAARLVDKAVSKGVIHKNKAARTKSRLARHLNNLKG